jgi:hypothetical protein
LDTRSFSIAMSDHVLALLLPALGARLPFEAPNVTIHTRGLSGLSTDPVTATERGEVDLSIGAFQAFAESCTELLYTDRWLCAVSADNPAVGDHMSLALFCRLPHLEWRLRTRRSETMRKCSTARKGTAPGGVDHRKLCAARCLRAAVMVALVHERLARQIRA